MKKCEWRNICLILLLLVIALGFGQTVKASEEHVPEGITMQPKFKPGYGETLGLFKKAIGKVVLVHTKDTFGYWAENDLPLYMKDTVVTPEEGLALLQFLDESTISVAEDSELTINRFIFDPSKFDRSTFINMKSGKARFWVKKLEGYTRSEFKIKTKTMVAGVRGTNIAIIYGGEREPSDGPQVLRGEAKVRIKERQPLVDVKEAEELVVKKGGKEIPQEIVDVQKKGQKEGTAGEVVKVFVFDGEIEVISLKNPEKVVVLRGGEKVTVVEGQEVSPVEKIPPAEAARLKREMPMPSDQGVMDAAGVFKTEGTAGDSEEGEAKEEEAVDVVDKPVKEEVEQTVEADEPAPKTLGIEKPGEVKEEEVVEKVPEKTEKAPGEEEVVYVGGGVLYPPGELVPPDPSVEIDTIVDEPVIDWDQVSVASNPGEDQEIFDEVDVGSSNPAGGEAVVPAVGDLPEFPPGPTTP